LDSGFINSGKAFTVLFVFIGFHKNDNQHPLKYAIGNWQSAIK